MTTPAVTAKRTRRPDALTRAFLVLTAVYAIWALGLILLTVVAIAEPAFLYRDAKTALKAAGATVVLLIAGWYGWLSMTAEIMSHHRAL